ncbi:LacI family DNA-binding transcriptional regulator [Nesterenkonia halophila]|uniref:LacI family DNA-binding transcriptional regulator n=1 Tax=Nesterenkonia halophila TaxID=302044 RepID=UPI001290A949|nr:LacI family DNA-binding transcriptional regulator [Nesterenkonia halophila]
MAVRQVTLQDVAEAAGVSAKTVSRVVNGERYVAPATAERVERAVRDLGFRPDHAARTLARGRHFRMAGLLLTTLENPHVVALARGVEQVLREEGTSLLIASTDEDAEVERRMVEEFHERGVDSLVVVPSGDVHQHLAEAAERMSMVLAHRAIDGIDADSVAPDDVGSTRAAVAELLAVGHRRIAFLGDLEYIYNIRRRHDGYRQAYREAGAPIDERLIRFGMRTAEDAAMAVRALLDAVEPPTAIFATNNLLCLGALTALRAAGRAGEDVSSVHVVGFDDLPEAQFVTQPVTLLSYDKAEVGRIAARLLVSRAAGRHRDPEEVTVPVEVRRIRD